MALNMEMSLARDGVNLGKGTDDTPPYIYMAVYRLFPELQPLLKPPIPSETHLLSRAMLIFLDFMGFRDGLQ